MARWNSFPRSYSLFKMRARDLLIERSSFHSSHVRLALNFLRRSYVHSVYTRFFVGLLAFVNREQSFVPVLSRGGTTSPLGLGTSGNEVGKEIFKQTPLLLRHKRGGIEPKVGSKDVAPLHEGSLNSFHGQLQLAFMPRFAYRSKIISRTLSLIFVSDVSAGKKYFLVPNFSAKVISEISDYDLRELSEREGERESSKVFV